MRTISAIARILLVVLVSILPVSLPILAYASPPDPSWIPGVYDDDDYDDVVMLVASGTGHVTPTTLADLRSVLPLVECLPRSSERVSGAFSASAVRPRAPPAS
jgi:hypothetical protein